MNKITHEYLTSVGFTKKYNIYARKELYEFDKIYYDPDIKIARYIKSEFSSFQKKCETNKDVSKFIDCVKFLCDRSNKCQQFHMQY